jgi:hypothetical protein
VLPTTIGDMSRGKSDRLKHFRKLADLVKRTEKTREEQTH